MRVLSTNMQDELYIQYNKNSPIHPIYKELKVKDIIDTIISHNEIICLWVEDEEDPHFSRQLWRGHAHKLPEEYSEYRFLSINGVCAESLYQSDTININVTKIGD